MAGANRGEFHGSIGVLSAYRVREALGVPRAWVTSAYFGAGITLVRMGVGLHDGWSV